MAAVSVTRLGFFILLHVERLWYFEPLFDIQTYISGLSGDGAGVGVGEGLDAGDGDGLGVGAGVGVEEETDEGVGGCGDGSSSTTACAPYSSIMASTAALTLFFSPDGVSSLANTNKTARTRIINAATASFIRLSFIAYASLSTILG